jgi:hypothetical protein
MVRVSTLGGLDMPKAKAYAVVERDGLLGP